MDKNSILDKYEIDELQRVVDYLNETWYSNISFELVDSINGTWYIYPKFPEKNDGQAKEEKEEGSETTYRQNT